MYETFTPSHKNKIKENKQKQKHSELLSNAKNVQQIRKVIRHYVIYVLHQTP